MKSYRNMLVCLAVLASVISASAGSAWYKAQDSESPFLIRYVGDGPLTGLTATATALGITLVAVPESGGPARTSVVTFNGNDLSTVVGAINALVYTNVAGLLTNNVGWQAMVWAGVNADQMGTNCLGSTNALEARVWTRVSKWDTSACLHYDLVPAFMIGSSIVPDSQVDQVFGSIGGTGNVTLTIYNAQNALYTKVITSPTYVWTPQTGATNLVAVDSVTLNETDLGLRLGLGQVPLIRAARATTATTGGIGCSSGD